MREFIQNISNIEFEEKPLNYNYISFSNHSLFFKLPKDESFITKCLEIHNLLRSSEDGFDEVRVQDDNYNWIVGKKIPKIGEFYLFCEGTVPERITEIAFKSLKSLF